MRWPPFQHVFFDCDSTLTTVEGIDVLADTVGKGWRVGTLTQAAMDGDLDLEEVYAKRLKTVRPTRGQINALRQVYKRSTVEDAIEVIDCLQKYGHDVYIISGGLYEPVLEFGLFLGIPRDHIRAVGVEFDALSGHWWQSGDHFPNLSERYQSVEKQPLTLGEGKTEIIRELLDEKRGRSILIGDGMSDLKAGAGVDLFVAFAGIVSRQKVIDKAPVSIHSSSLAPFLALAVGPSALRSIADSRENQVAVKAFRLVEEGVITFKDEQLKEKFLSAFSGPHQALYSGPFGS